MSRDPSWKHPASPAVQQPYGIKPVVRNRTSALRHAIPVKSQSKSTSIAPCEGIFSPSVLMPSAPGCALGASRSAHSTHGAISRFACPIHHRRLDRAVPLVQSAYRAGSLTLATFEDWFRLLSVRVRGVSLHALGPEPAGGQTPTCSGEVQRVLLGVRDKSCDQASTADGPVRVWRPPGSRTRPNWLWLSAGALHGLTVGSHWLVQRPHTGRTLCTTVVTALSTTTAVARIQRLVTAPPKVWLCALQLSTSNSACVVVVSRSTR